MINFKKILVLLVAIFLSFSLSAASSYPTLEEHIKTKQFAKAYKKASELSAENEGDPRFDFLYGLAALETGNYNEAVFALERVKFSTPNVIRPRLELARAYLKLKNQVAALNEFKSVLKLSPPATVRQNVKAYIAAIGKKQSPLKIKSIVKSLASFSLGYDDNLNFGVENELVDIPIFGSVILNPDSVKQSSGFAESRFQIQQRKARNKQSSTFAMANLTHRDYFKNGDFNLTDLDFRTGILWNKDNRQYQLIARDRPVLLGGSLYSNTIGLDMIARQALANKNLASISLSVENYDFKPLKNADRKRAYLTGRYDFNQANSFHRLSASVGKEWPDDKDGEQFSRDIAALSYQLTQNWNVKNKSFFGVNYGEYKYQGNNALSSEKRKDTRTVIDAGHDFKINDKTSIIFSLRHINNNSNLDLYDAKRNEVRMGVRYEWN